MCDLPIFTESIINVAPLPIGSHRCKLDAAQSNTVVCLTSARRRSSRFACHKQAAFEKMEAQFDSPQISRVLCLYKRGKSIALMTDFTAQASCDIDLQWTPQKQQEKNYFFRPVIAACRPLPALSARSRFSTCCSFCHHICDSPSHIGQAFLLLKSF
jgi:hypothetical protein